MERGPCAIVEAEGLRPIAGRSPDWLKMKNPACAPRIACHSLAENLESNLIGWIGGLHAPDEAGCDAKTPEGSRTSVRSGWRVFVVGERRISRCGRWPGGEHTVQRRGNGSGIALSEEEISDVSLGTFYVFDKENAGASKLGEQYARGCRGCGGCRGCRGCRGCARGCGGGGCGGCGGCGCCLSWGSCRIC